MKGRHFIMAHSHLLAERISRPEQFVGKGLYERSHAIPLVFISGIKW